MSKVIFEIEDDLKKQLNVFLAQKGLTAKDFFTKKIIDALKNDK